MEGPAKEAYGRIDQEKEAKREQNPEENLPSEGIGPEHT
jgi:hypothetical protein